MKRAYLFNSSLERALANELLLQNERRRADDFPVLLVVRDDQDEVALGRFHLVEAGGVFFDADLSYFCQLGQQLEKSVLIVFD